MKIIPILLYYFLKKFTVGVFAHPYKMLRFLNLWLGYDGQGMGAFSTGSHVWYFHFPEVYLNLATNKDFLSVYNFHISLK